MQILLAKNFREFIAGVFEFQADAVAFKEKISKSDQLDLRLLEVDLSYPFFITEDFSGFGFYSESEIVEVMNSFLAEMAIHDDDWCYTNLYIITEDFSPGEPGKDCMGILKHYHVENRVLKLIASNGFSSFF